MTTLHDVTVAAALDRMYANGFGRVFTTELSAAKIEAATKTFAEKGAG
jgi:hypothetical protein